MGFFKRKVQAFKKATIRVVRSRYDAAQTTGDNSRHWANTDGLSPVAAHTEEVRRTLRNRARYETANNSYARGIVNTLANDVVGNGTNAAGRSNFLNPANSQHCSF